METARFGVSSLRDGRDALDLSNALNSLSGVAGVQVDVAGHRVVITYDPSHAGVDLLQAAIDGSGYAPATVEG